MYQLTSHVKYHLKVKVQTFIETYSKTSFGNSNVSYIYPTVLNFQIPEFSVNASKQMLNACTWEISKLRYLLWQKVLAIERITCNCIVYTW